MARTAASGERAVWIAYEETEDNRVALGDVVVCSSEIAARRTAMSNMADGAVARVPYGMSILDAVVAEGQRVEKKKED